MYLILNSQTDHKTQKKILKFRQQLHPAKFMSSEVKQKKKPIGKVKIEFNGFLLKRNLNKKIVEFFLFVTTVFTVLTFGIIRAQLKADQSHAIHQGS